MSVELTWGRAAQIWWSFYWRAALIVFVSATGLLFMGIALDLPGLAESPPAWLAVIAVAGIVMAQVWAMRQALEVNYRECRVILTAPYAVSRLEELEASAAAE